MFSPTFGFPAQLADKAGPDHVSHSLPTEISRCGPPSLKRIS